MKRITRYIIIGLAGTITLLMVVLVILSFILEPDETCEETHLTFCALAKPFIIIIFGLLVMYIANKWIK